MISYAQNHEDVRLQRCFGEQTSGFYIDVGAWEPVLHSVTYHFYELGWHGVNVEPVTEYFAMLTEARPRDVNLPYALSDRRGDLAFSFVEGSGLSTPRALGDDLVDDLAAGGFATVRGTVRALTLADVCRTHVPPGQEIDFLKIDVEGWEGHVVRGGDWDRDRPRVVVVETATPVGFDPVARRVQIEDFSPTWEQELLAHGYLFAAADGVNRWYVRSEDEHLLQHFRFPVSSLDEFIPYSLVLAQRPVGELSESLNQLRGELDVAREELARDRERLGVIEGRSAAAEATLAALLRSRSWRYTAPLRTASAWLHRRRMSTTPAGEPRSPALAQAPAPAPLRVALYAGVVVERDAVSTSLLHKLRILRQLEELGYAVTTIVFTQGTDVDRPGVAIVGPEQLVEEGACLAADLHIYEFGMHYELFDTHVRLPQQARTLVVDHSTTPPTLVGSVEAAEKCAEAIQRRDKLSWAHHVTNVSEHNRAHHLDRGVDGNRLSVLHLPPVAATGRAVIDSAPIASRPGPVHLLFVGRFVKAKGVEDLLDVFETVVERHGDEVRLTLVGNADFSEPDLLERIDRSVARGFVERRSNLGDTELASLYRSAHAFVLPSYHEGYCVPVVEAMWAGTFPLTYDAGNLPIVSGGLGALVPTGDRRGLERSIEDFIGRVAASRADGRLMLATNGFGEMTEADWRAAVAAHLVDYSWERYAEGFLDLMARVLADRPEGVPEWLRHDRGGLVRQLRP